ncbi:hypothetical protein CRENBAI_026044 [Crenichthys baileyi]|uniref:Uncharacterized protein n=1 Tax=Crenichthys baileyi TaxID=28760 RepID=A0AAV9RP76_9TELE
MACPLQVGGEFLPQVEEFKYLRIFLQVRGEWSEGSTNGLVRLPSRRGSEYSHCSSEVALTFVSNAPWTAPLGGVSGMSHQEEGTAQDMLEGLCLPAGLALPRKAEMMNELMKRYAVCLTGGGARRVIGEGTLAINHAGQKLGPAAHG